MNSQKKIHFTQIARILFSLQDYPCTIIPIPNAVAVTGLWAFGYQKNSELLELFNYHQEKLTQSGLRDKIADVYFRHRKEAQCPRSFGINVAEVVIMFFILASGIVISMVLVCSEVIIRNLKTPRKDALKVIPSL